MTATTSNLGLTTYNNTTDQSGSFLSWTRAMSGSANSNMTRIDDFAGWVSGSISAVSGSASGSVAVLSGSMTNISGSITSLNSAISVLSLRLAKIDEFSGAGLADFNNISGSYTHLLLMGIAAGNYAASELGLGIDFNGDANSANYSVAQWCREVAPVALEYLQNYLYGQIMVANIPGTSLPGYGGGFFAIIPNYSASGGLYKTAMGFSAFASTGGTMWAAMTGGVWKSTSAITRVRAFATAIANAPTRNPFVAGTLISLYGIG